MKSIHTQKRYSRQNETIAEIPQNPPPANNDQVRLGQNIALNNEARTSLYPSAPHVTVNRLKLGIIYLPQLLIRKEYQLRAPHRRPLARSLHFAWHRFETHDDMNKFSV